MCRQKLGILVKIKCFKNWSYSKRFWRKMFSWTIIINVKKIIEIPIDHWLWNSDFGHFLTNWQSSIYKISFDYVYFLPEILLIMSHRWKSSITELMLFYIPKYLLARLLACLAHRAKYTRKLLHVTGVRITSLKLLLHTYWPSVKNH